MKKTMPVLISFLIWLFIGTITIFVTIPIILYTLFFWWVDSSRRLQHSLSTFWGRWVTHVSPQWTIDISGMQHFPKNRVFVAVSNHSSLADIIVLYNLNRQFKWVSKESLFKIPFFGWGMHACGYIPLKRGVQTSIRDTYEKALYWLKKNISIMMFPEGTRSKEGHLGAFHNGAFKLALKANVPVLPIIILGSKNIVEKGSWLLTRKVHIRMFVLPPVAVEPYEPDHFEKLRDRVREIMAEKIAQSE